MLLSGSRIWSAAMKTILSALVALSVLAGIAGSANALDTKFFALDTKFFWEQQDRQSS
jgi:hypothetical protein